MGWEGPDTRYRNSDEPPKWGGGVPDTGILLDLEGSGTGYRNFVDLEGSGTRILTLWYPCAVLAGKMHVLTSRLMYGTMGTVIAGTVIFRSKREENL